LDVLRTYYETIGIEFIAEQHGTGPRHYSGQLGNLILELYPLTGDGLADQTTRLGFVVKDLSAVVKALEVGGATFVKRPE
jgi:hypothetical protein